MFTPKQIIESLQRYCIEHPELANEPIKLKIHTEKKDKRRFDGYRYDTVQTDVSSIAWNRSAGTLGEISINGTIGAD